MQHIIAFILGVSIFGGAIWALDYTVYNLNGVVHPVANIFGALFSSTKLTAIRLLVLLVALGFKIIRPTLQQKHKMAIIVLMIIYFIVEASQEYIAVAESSGEEIQNGLQGTMAFFLGITEIIIVIWVGYEVSKSIVDPNLLNHPSKLKMYKNLIRLLFVVVSISFPMAIIEIVFESYINQYNLWRFIWIFGTYWEVIYFVTIVFIGWVWHPSGDNARYAYEGIPSVELREEIEMREDGVVDLEEETKKNSSSSVSE